MTLTEFGDLPVSLITNVTQVGITEFSCSAVLPFSAHQEGGFCENTASDRHGDRPERRGAHCRCDN
jgi:hypothetical protein